MRRKERPSPEIPLTSTSDVAFLLLIFFLVAASNSTDMGTRFDPPSTEKTQQQEQKQTNLEVTITDKDILVAGDRVEKDQDLASVIREKLKGKHEPQDRIVLITASDNSTYQIWSNVMAAVEMAGGVPAPQIDEGQGEDKDQQGEQKPAAAPAQTQPVSPGGGT